MLFYALAIGTVIFVFASSYAAYYIGRNSSHSKPSRDDAYRKNPGLRTFRVHVINSGWDADQAEHSSNERRYWRKSIVLNYVYVSLTAVAAAAAGAAYLQARNQTDIARKALIADSRPWVWLKTDPILKGLSIVNRTWAIAQVDIQLTNFGKSPARYVFLTTRLVPSRPLKKASVSAQVAASAPFSAVEGPVGRQN